VSLAKATPQDGSKGTPFSTQEEALAFVRKTAKKGEKRTPWVQVEGQLYWDKL
jgi:hypothetical protein